MSVSNRTRVKVSVREARLDVDATQLVVKEAPFDHVRYQVLLKLKPLGARASNDFARDERTANWVAETWSKPPIRQGMRLVQETPDGVDLRYFEVVKSFEQGRLQRLELIQRDVEQPDDATG